MADLWSAQEIYRISLQHLVMLKNKKVIKTNKPPHNERDMSKGHRKPTESFQWPQL